MSLVYAAPFLVLILCILIWFKSGRDTGGRKVIIAEYEPPTDLSPAEVGVLDDFKATDREITATLVDLAVRGYISIERVPKTYQFTLLKDDVLDLKAHEKELLDGLFGVASAKLKSSIHSKLTSPEAIKKAQQYPALSSEMLIGKTVRLDQLSSYFYQYVNNAKQSMFDNLMAAGYFASHPWTAGAPVYCLALASFIASFWTSKDYQISLWASATIFLICGALMQSRSRRGTRAKEVVDGFKDFIQTAESSRINLTQTPNNALGKTTVELYEKYLPYAIALGIEGQWNSKFKNIYTEPIDWLARNPIDDIFELTGTVSGILSSD